MKIILFGRHGLYHISIAKSGVRKGEETRLPYLGLVNLALAVLVTCRTTLGATLVLLAPLEVLDKVFLAQHLVLTAHKVGMALAGLDHGGFSLRLGIFPALRWFFLAGFW